MASKLALKTFNFYLSKVICIYVLSKERTYLSENEKWRMVPDFTRKLQKKTVLRISKPTCISQIVNP